MELQYVYLIHEREFIQSEKQVYKIGKTKQLNLKRYAQYPKDSALLYQSTSINCDIHEKEIITLFKNKYKHRKDIGSEYFEGDYRNMLCDIYDISTRLLREQIQIEEVECKRAQEKEEERIKVEGNSSIELNRYCCLVCKFSTDNKAQLRRHFTSKKHETNTKPILQVPTRFQCEKCNKYYKGQSGLWGHVRKCK